MPLRISAVSEAERQQIEQEWDTERSYSLSHLSSTRRSALKFVKAVKTDEEWTRQSRAGLAAANGQYKLKTSVEIAEENARWYRELVGGSTGSSNAVTRENSVTAVDIAPVADQEQPIATTSKITLEALPSHALRGQGSQDVPFTLDDEEEEDEADYEEEERAEVAVTAESQASAPTSLSVPRHPEHRPLDSSNGKAKAIEQRALTRPPEHKADELEHEVDVASGEEAPAMEETQDMYCLLCKTVVPASDVAGHRTSILHQLSKGGNRDAAPLIPPTHYAVRSSNVGYSMLQKLGWTEDKGLGSSQLGRKTPLKASEKFDRKGVGVDSKRRAAEAEMEGKIVKRYKQPPQQAARPLAKNKKELERAKKKEMQMFKEGLAYLNT